jgi:phage terminase large subunit-like protein
MAQWQNDMEYMIDSRWIKTKSDQAAIEAGCTFDIRHAERVKNFCETFLKLSIDEWAGQPFRFLPWQLEDVIYPLWSWRRPDGTRRFSQASIWIPKNNGGFPLSGLTS